MGVVAVLLVILLSVNPAAAESGLAPALEAELALRAQTPLGPALMLHYQRHSFQPLWVEAQRPSARLEGLLAVIDHSDDDGLNPAFYQPERLRALMDAEDVAGLARLEVAASLAALRLATDLQAGHLAPRLADPELFVHPRHVLVEQVMVALRGAGDIALTYAGWAPASAEYRRLRSRLVEYRQIVADGGWPLLEDGATLQAGMIDARVPMLRRRLIAEGYRLAVPEAALEVYDPALVEAVRQFQGRHGLDVDGIIGSATRAALAVPAKDRLRQLELNMERLRWMPDDLGRHHVLVNIAAFELALVREGRTVLEMPVAVGRPYRRTPVFSGRMTYLEFNPTWTVPATIWREDMLPKLRKDANALKKLGIRMFDGYSANAREIDPASIDWRAVKAGSLPFRLRQDPGPKNPLGRVKFMLPNEHDIYLHDTPDKSNFEKSMRAFSSGCIRLANPRQLAVELLSNQPSWTPARIDQALAPGPTQVVRLQTPVPVHFTYMTAWSGVDGVMYFRDDIYGRDKRLALALPLP